MSQNEQLLGVIGGKNCIKEIEEIYSLHVYKINEKGDHFELVVERHFSQHYRDFSLSICFDKEHQYENIIFINKSCIMKYNYMTDKLTKFYDFKNELSRQPDFLVFDNEQKECIIASTDDVLHVNLVTQVEIDIDETFKISAIKSLIYINGIYYILANKFEGKLGYFVLEFNKEIA